MKIPEHPGIYNAGGIAFGDQGVLRTPPQKKGRINTRYAQGK